MPRRFRTLPTLLWLAALFAAATPAWAQFGPGGGGRPMGPGGQPGMGGGANQGASGEKEEEQAAEAVPENQAQEQALQPLPAWPGQEKKALQFFEMHGYMRGRAYLFNKFDLGVNQGTTGVKPPFYVPYTEFQGLTPKVSPSCNGREGGGCRTNTMTSADMRLRLEPIINVTDQVRVHVMADIFDNLVLGSTPEGYFINGQQPSANVPIAAFSNGQAPVVQGVNSLTASIQVKRAWAEVKTPIGELRFGRMPISHVLYDQYVGHWGAGLAVNNGDCLDCDYGTTVDRIMFTSKLFNHYISLMWDWGATGPTTALYNPNFLTGQAYNADPLVNLQQWALALGRQDKPEELKERIDRGDTVINYGGYFTYRRQDWDLKNNINIQTSAQSPAGALLGVGPMDLVNNITPRGYWSFKPDLWFRLNWHKLQIEAEGLAIFGNIQNTTTTSTGTTTMPVSQSPTIVSNTFSGATGQALQLLQFGGVIRFDYKLLHDALKIGLEIGSASGDPSEDPNGSVNYRIAQILRPASQQRITNFQFDPDYHVDLILYRRILGTVSNATYIKPHASYDILDNLQARVDVIYSLANTPVGYPGNNANLGLELDGSIMYHNDEEGFYAGISYGVLFPFAALSYPSSIYGTQVDAQTAQTVQGRVAVKF